MITPTLILSRLSPAVFFPVSRSGRGRGPDRRSGASGRADEEPHNVVTNTYYHYEHYYVMFIIRITYVFVMKR